jgi:hypothetical protein
MGLCLLAARATLLRECPPDWRCQSSPFISLRKAARATVLTGQKE